VVTSSWNSPRFVGTLWRASCADVAVDCEEGSRLAAVSAEMEASEAAVEARCRIWSARFEALRDGLWKRVMGSRVLGWKRGG
jgi:hypothetical protein